MLTNMNTEQVTITTPRVALITFISSTASLTSIGLTAMKSSLRTLMGPPRDR